METNRARLAEMYTTVAAIETAEDMFFAEKDRYAAKYDGVDKPNDNLCFTDSDACRANFSTILGVDIPAESPFAYEVSGAPARISVMVKALADKRVLGYRVIEGPQKNRWFINIEHPWAKSISVEGVQFYTP